VADRRLRLVTRRKRRDMTVIWTPEDAAALTAELSRAQAERGVPIPPEARRG